MTSDKTPKPVFPSGYEPAGLRRDEYDLTSDLKAAVADAKRRDRTWNTRAVNDDGIELCFECGGEGQCIYCDGLGCDECMGHGVCTICDGSGEDPDAADRAERERDRDPVLCGKCGGAGQTSGGKVCDRCDGTGEAPDDHRDWDGDTYLGGYGRSGWDNYRTSTHTYDWDRDRGNARRVSSYTYPKPAPRTWRNAPWSEWRSREFMASGNMFLQIYAKYRDAQDYYSSCTEKRHWGPRGGAGLVPWTRAPDGKVYVLLSHRSGLVENGNTWSSFGGAIDKEDKSPFHAAVREAFEEVEGLSPDGIITREVARPCHACGWVYTTFLVLVKPSAVRVNRKAGSGWETSEVKWVELADVSTYKLHPGFSKTWPELHQAILHATRKVKP